MSDDEPPPLTEDGIIPKENKDLLQEGGQNVILPEGLVAQIMSELPPLPSTPEALAYYQRLASPTSPTVSQGPLSPSQVPSREGAISRFGSGQADSFERRNPFTGLASPSGEGRDDEEKMPTLEPADELELEEKKEQQEEKKAILRYEDLPIDRLWTHNEDTVKGLDVGGTVAFSIQGLPDNRGLAMAVDQPSFWPSGRLPQEARGEITMVRKGQSVGLDRGEIRVAATGNVSQQMFTELLSFTKKRKTFTHMFPGSFAEAVRDPYWEPRYKKYTNRWFLSDQYGAFIACQQYLSSRDGTQSGIALGRSVVAVLEDINVESRLRNEADEAFNGGAFTGGGPARFREAVSAVLQGLYDMLDSDFRSNRARARQIME